MDGLSSLKILAFVVLSAALAWVSRLSLRLQWTHGFYRFFAWEAILGLILLNLEAWFRNPFSWHQVISWPLLLVSLFLVFHGWLLLRRMGLPDEKRAEQELLPLEKTTRLVTTGAYRFIRHPLYSSLLCLAWGVFFKQPSWAGTALALAATGFLYLTARVEEAENLRFFGVEYAAYMQRTRRFIPFVF